LWTSHPGAGRREEKRALTNLYNARPTLLDLAHKRLDEAVFAAYGWKFRVVRRRDPGKTDGAEFGEGKGNSLNNAMLIIDRVFVESDCELSSAYALSRQIQVTSLSHR
jgi:hypothetical protein